MTRILLTIAAAMAATPALAHLDPAEHGSLVAGLSHPLLGPDHVLAMVAVGLWAALSAGRALWALPAAFVGSMGLGYAGAVLGMPLPLVEPMILLSVSAFGLAVALAVRLPLPAAVGVTALFGLFHGHAHGGELGAAGVWAFGLGFAAASAALHAAGVGAAVAARRALAGSALVRGLGWATAAGGLWVALAG